MIRRLTTIISLLLLPSLVWSQALWLRDLMKKDKEETPEFSTIQFWDPQQERYRGFRVFFHTVKEDRNNEQVDIRFQNIMEQYLDRMCHDVVGINSFEDPVQMEVVKNVTELLVDEWKVNGRIKPETIFMNLPFLKVDLLVLMERTVYDHQWRNDKKYLLIGVDIGVFELDFGEPLYLNRKLLEIPWSGESASYSKAEQSAMLQVANAIGERLDSLASYINKQHVLAEQQAIIAKNKEEKEREAQLKAEDKEMRTFFDMAEAYQAEHDIPIQIADPLQKELQEFEDLVRKSGTSLTPQELAQRQALRDRIEQRLHQHQMWMEEEAKPDPIQPRVSEPTQTPSPTDQEVEPDQTPVIDNPIPDFSIEPGRNIFSRDWLIPGYSAPAQMQNTPAPTPTPQVAPAVPNATPVDDGSDTNAPPPIPREFIEQKQSGSVADATVESATP